MFEISPRLVTLLFGYFAVLLGCILNGNARHTSEKRLGRRDSTTGKRQRRLSTMFFAGGKRKDPCILVGMHVRLFVFGGVGWGLVQSWRTTGGQNMRTFHATRCGQCGTIGKGGKSSKIW